MYLFFFDKNYLTLKKRKKILLGFLLLLLLIPQITLAKNINNKYDKDYIKQVEKQLYLDIETIDNSKSFLNHGLGYYYDQETTQYVDFDNAYTLLSPISPFPKSHLYASIGVMGMVGFGAASYWTSFKAGNVQDWDLKWDWESWKGKLNGQYVTFDNNSLVLNSIGHSLTGMCYYMWPRFCNLNQAWSLFYAVLGSTLWEYLGECFEKPSINDMILTPIAGMALGEPIYQLLMYSINYYKYNKNNYFPTISPYSIINLSFGMSTSIKYGLKTPYQFIKFIFNLESDLVNIPGYNFPGKINKFLFDSNFTKVYIQTKNSNENAGEFRFLTQTSLCGFYYKNLHYSDGKMDIKHLKGYNLYAGIATAFEMNRYNDLFTLRPEHKNYDPSPIDETKNKKFDNVFYFGDNIDIVKILGPELHADFYYNDWRFKLYADTFFDFAFVSPFPLEDYLGVHGSEGIKSVLKKEKYYYAYGITSSLKLEIYYKKFGLLLKGYFDWFESIEGKDRFQEEITHDFHCQDYRLTGDTAISYQVFKEFKIVVGCNLRRRSGEIEGTYPYSFARRELNTTAYAKIVHKL